MVLENTPPGTPMSLRNGNKNGENGVSTFYRSSTLSNGNIDLPFLSVESIYIFDV